MKFFGLNARYWILLLFVALCLPYVFATPIFEKNDESEHFAMGMYLAEGNGLAVQKLGEKTEYMQEGSQPPLYYFLISLPLRILNTQDYGAFVQPNASTLYEPYALSNKNRFVITPAKRAFSYNATALSIIFLRLLNIVPGGIAVWFSYGVAHGVTRHHAKSLLAMAFTAFNPMLLTVSTAVSNDVCAIAFCTVVMAQLVQNKFTIKNVFMLGLMIGLATLTKLGGLILLPLACLCIVLCKNTVLQKARWISLMGLVWITVAGWWFARNFFLYGELTGTQLMAQIAGARGISLQQVIGEFQGFRISYLGIFGQFTVAAEWQVYQLFDQFLLLCAFGLLLGVARFVLSKPKRAETATNTRAVMIIALHITLTLVSIARWTTMTTASQGRLLFPAIAGVSTLMSMGIWQVGLIFPKIRCVQVAHIVSVFCAIGFGLFATVVPFRYILPAYQPPLLAQLPQNMMQAQQRIGTLAILEGYTFSPNHIQPSQKLRVSLFTRTLTNTEFNYGYVVKLYDRNNQEIARRFTYPGNGLWNTVFWRRGDLVQDDLEFVVPTSITTPSTLRVQAELYNPGSGDIPKSTDANGNVITPLYDIATAVRPSTQAEKALAQFGNFGALVSAKVNNTQVVLRWQPIQPAPKNYTVFVHVLNASGIQITQADAPPLQGNFPTSQWLASEAFDDVHVLTLPAGSYRLHMGMYDPTNGERARATDAQGQALPNDTFEIDIHLK